MRTETVERVRDALLLIFSIGTQLTIFALCIHVLVGPTPQWKAGTSLLRLHHESSDSNVRDFYLGPLVGRLPPYCVALGLTSDRRAHV